MAKLPQIPKELTHPRDRALWKINNWLTEEERQAYFQQAIVGEEDEEDEGKGDEDAEWTDDDVINADPGRCRKPMVDRI